MNRKIMHITICSNNFCLGVNPLLWRFLIFVMSSTIPTSAFAKENASERKIDTASDSFFAYNRNKAARLRAIKAAVTKPIPPIVGVPDFLLCHDGPSE